MGARTRFVSEYFSKISSGLRCPLRCHTQRVDSTARRQFEDSFYNVLARSDSAALLFRQCQAFRILYKFRDDVVEPSVISVYFKHHGKELQRPLTCMLIKLFLAKLRALITSGP